MHLRRPSTLPLLLALLLIFGCGEADHFEAVAGVVRYRGKPLAGGTIVFAPDPTHGGNGPMACGTIGSDGRYSFDAKLPDGISAGWHRITFAAAPGQELPARYSDPERSRQTREVIAGTVNEINFNLE